MAFRIGRLAFLPLLAGALLAPFVGQALDHHFVERLPGHQHVYLTGALAHHLHPFETAHAREEGHEDSDGGIVFLPPGEEGTAGPELASALFDLLPLAGIRLTSVLILPRPIEGLDSYRPAPDLPPPRPSPHHRPV